MPTAPSAPPRDRAEDRRYLFDMLEQLAAIAVCCGEKDVADVLYALVAVHGGGDDESYSTASN